MYPNFAPVRLSLPERWRDKKLKFYVGCNNRASVRLVSSNKVHVWSEIFAKDKTISKQQASSGKRQLYQLLD